MDKLSLAEPSTEPSRVRGLGVWPSTLHALLAVDMAFTITLFAMVCDVPFQ